LILRFFNCIDAKRFGMSAVPKANVHA